MHSSSEEQDDIREVGGCIYLADRPSGLIPRASKLDDPQKLLSKAFETKKQPGRLTESQ
jgi:hypothetical protein